MKKDNILRRFMNDDLILRFGERMYYKRDLEEHTADHISGRMRELARLVECLREDTQMRISSLTQALNVAILTFCCLV